MKNYRWVIVFGVCLINFLAYIDRVNLSVAATTIMKEFNLSGAQIGLLLGAMLPSYMLFNVIGGAISDRYSPMKVINIGITVWSLSTTWFAQVTSFFWMYVSRLVFGAAEGVYPSVCTKINSNWMLPRERGRSQSLMAATALIGVAVGAPFCGAIIKAYDWRTLFYLVTLFGFVVIAILSIIMKNSPREHRWVSREELELIEKTLEEERIRKEYAPGHIAVREEIYALLKNPYLWLLALGYFTIAAIWWANLTWLPGYLVKERGFTVFKSGLWSSFPFFIGAVGLVSGGFFTDKFMKGRRIPYIILCHLVAPIIVFFAIGASSDTAMILGFSLSMFFSAGALGQYWPLPMELFPRKLAGTASGIMSGVGTIGGMFAPVLLGRVYDITKSFYWGFGSLAIVAFIGAIIAVPLLYYELRLNSNTRNAVSLS